MSPEALYRSRPRSLFLRASTATVAVAVALSWWIAGADAGRLLRPQVGQNLRRFGSELVPPALRDHPIDPVGWAQWWMGHLLDTGLSATAGTVALSLCAMGVASLIALPLASCSSRRLASPDLGLTPHGLRGALAQGTRLFAALLRALPEYLLAFLLLALTGPGAWPAVLALALHNGGILAKLWSETLDDADPRPAQALQRIGATRTQTVLRAYLPQISGRGTLYLFTRWETAVRESTVLGLLGFVGIGWYVQDARARLHYDDMAFYIGLAALVVVVGDLVGVGVRRMLRDAS
jgi:phosphonate transport system permease protein